jgi:hypothetical protein
MNPSRTKSCDQQIGNQVNLSVQEMRMSFKIDPPPLKSNEAGPENADFTGYKITKSEDCPMLTLFAAEITSNNLEHWQFED